jgi:hypothetical protein
LAGLALAWPWLEEPITPRFLVGGFIALDR